MHMRTTLIIDDQLLARASELTGIKEKTALVRMGLEYLIARESAKRLAKLGGTAQISSRSPDAAAIGKRWSSSTRPYGSAISAPEIRKWPRCSKKEKLFAIPSSLESWPAANYRIGRACSVTSTSSRGPASPLTTR